MEIIESRNIAKKTKIIEANEEPIEFFASYRIMIE